MPELTVYKAYLTAHLFLHVFWLYYKHKYNDFLPALLGAMSFSADGLPADLALKDKWLQAAQKSAYERISAEEAFDSMLAFLELERIDDDTDIMSVLKLLKLNKTSPSIQETWAECIDQVLHGSTEFIYLRFVKPGKRI